MPTKNVSHRDFLNKNSTPQLMIETLTNGVLAPDIKAITILAMQYGVPYSKTALYNQVRSFAGTTPSLFPIAGASVWRYCNGSTSYESNLASTDMIVKTATETLNTVRGRMEVIAYEKTDAGRDFGDPTAALGIWFVNKLVAVGKLQCRSLLSVFKTENKESYATHRRGYAVHKIISHLANNQDYTFREADLSSILEINQQSLSTTLNSLGQAGFIEYISPHRDQSGRKTKDWALYKSDEKLDYKTCLADIRAIEPRFFYPTGLEIITDHFNRNVGEGIKRSDFADKIPTPSNISHILSMLEVSGHVTAQFKGSERISAAKANKFTVLLWNELLRPIDMVAESMDPDLHLFKDRLSLYKEDTRLLKSHIETVYGVYAEERRSRGIEAGQRLRLALLGVLRSEAGKPLKRSELAERINVDILGLGRQPITADTIDPHLRLLLREEKINRVSKSMYVASDT